MPRYQDALTEGASCQGKRSGYKTANLQDSEKQNGEQQNSDHYKTGLSLFLMFLWPENQRTHDS